MKFLLGIFIFAALIQSQELHAKDTNELTEKDWAQIRESVKTADSRESVLKLLRPIFKIGVRKSQIAAWPVALREFSQATGEFIVEFESNRIGTRHGISAGSKRAGSWEIKTYWGVILVFDSSERIKTMNVESFHRPHEARPSGKQNTYYVDDIKVSRQDFEKKLSHFSINRQACIAPEMDHGSMLSCPATEKETGQIFTYTEIANQGQTTYKLTRD